MFDLHESGENYLETILILEQKNGTVRSIDIANYLNYSKPSVSRAVGLLKRAGYLLMEQNGQLILTAEGRKRANKIYDRHATLTRFLSLTLGVSEEAAMPDACRIEHVISEENYQRVKQYVRRGSPSPVPPRSKDIVP